MNLIHPWLVVMVLALHVVSAGTGSCVKCHTLLAGDLLPPPGVPPLPGPQAHGRHTGALNKLNKYFKRENQVQLIDDTPKINLNSKAVGALAEDGILAIVTPDSCHQVRLK